MIHIILIFLFIISIGSFIIIHKECIPYEGVFKVFVINSIIGFVLQGWRYMFNTLLDPTMPLTLEGNSISILSIIISAYIGIALTAPFAIFTIWYYTASRKPKRKEKKNGTRKHHKTFR